MDQQQIDVKDITSALQRRWKLIALVGTILSAFAVFVALLLPPIYSATAKILVQSQSIPEDLARSMVTANLPERLSYIEQRLMAQNNVVSLAQRLELFSSDERLTRAQIAESVRDATEFKTLTVGSRRRANVYAFTITYRHRDPAVAALVANELVSLVLQQNIETRNTLASGTVEFFRSEVARLSRELAEQEQAIAEFKNDNEGYLPEMLALHQSELLDTRARTFDFNNREARLKEERRILEATLDPNSSLFRGVDVLSPKEEELERLRRELLQKRTVYTEAHPDIVLIKSQIEALEGDLTPASARQSQQRGALELRQIEVIEAELKTIEAERQSIAKRQVELEDAIARVPGVEIRLNVLLRRYQAVKEQHDQAVSREREAAIGERLEVDRQAERFEVLEPAEVPMNRESPNRKMIAFAGGVGSFGFAFGLALLLELTNKTIRSSRDMERKLGLRPIVVVPVIRTKSEEARRILFLRIKYAVFAVVIPGLLALLHYYYLPLDLLSELFLQKSGIDGAVRFIESAFGW
ncbi:MAG: Wzz/FepE/Etk N-terminal domain-containing protein [Pseudomonadota bacterium]